MDSPQGIRNRQLEAARLASQRHNTPLVLWPEDLATEDAFRQFCRSMPMLGDYIPPGWSNPSVQTFQPSNPYYSYFVDSSGWGGASEPALTLSAFRQALIDLTQQYGFKFGLAIYSAGEFQVNIGLYVQEGA